MDAFRLPFAKAAHAPLPPPLRRGGVGGGGTPHMPRSIDRRVPRARSFRKNPTDAERKLWQHLRHLPPCAAHFRRQATIGPYFADFACHSNRIVVEIDGGQHADNANDSVRTSYLNAQGYRVLRFWNNDVFGNIDGVMETIIGALRVAPPTPDPSPPQGRGEGSSDDAGR
ncbi:MAG: endonuclease domain-containing protein [Xanthobacteraceae bacterium]